MLNSITLGYREKLPQLSSPSSPSRPVPGLTVHAVPQRARVRRSSVTKEPPAAAPRSALAADSLGFSLLLASRVLAAVAGGQSLNEALLAIDGEVPAAQAAARDVAYGTLRRYGRAEFILGQLMDRPLSHAPTQALLHGALYRLDTRPDAPAMVVDQAVAAAGELAGGVFKGLVNGVLRSYLRQREALLARIVDDEEAHFQHPRWWLSRLRRAYPEAWEAIVAAGNSPPAMTLRVNQRRTTRDDYLVQLASAGIAAQVLGNNALLLAKALPVGELPGFAAGLVSVQDFGAQRAAELLAPAAHARVLDACAAPGGKTAHLLEAVDIDLLALDIDARRTQRIGDNLERLGLAATLKVADCQDVGAWWDGRPFDAILADVPCSASGVVRRHPDIKHLRRESDVRRFTQTQAAILDALWPTLKVGGTLLYATCSVFGEENGGQIDAFLVRQPGAERISQEQLLPQKENDGFYYALLRKLV